MKRKLLGRRPGPIVDAWASDLYKKVLSQPEPPRQPTAATPPEEGNWVEQSSKDKKNPEKLSDFHKMLYETRLADMQEIANNPKFAKYRVVGWLQDESGQAGVAVSDGTGKAVIAFRGIAGMIRPIDDFASPVYSAVSKKQQAGFDFAEKVAREQGFKHVTLAGYSGGGAVAAYILFSSKNPGIINNVFIVNGKGVPWSYMIEKAATIRERGWEARWINQERDYVHFLLPQPDGTKEIIEAPYPDKPFYDGNVTDNHLLQSLLNPKTGQSSFMPTVKSDDALARWSIRAIKGGPGAIGGAGLLGALYARKRKNMAKNKGNKGQKGKEGR